MQPSSVTERQAGQSSPATLTTLIPAPLHVLTLGLDQEVFALETERVLEVLDVVAVTTVPNARRFIRGLINVRGRVVPVTDLRSKFGMGDAPTTPDTRIIVIEVVLRGQLSTVGILADRVYEVAELPHASLEETPRLGMTWRPEFIKSIGKRGDGFVIVLDIEKVFASEEAPISSPAGS